MLPREDNAFLGKDLSFSYSGNSYVLFVFRRLLSNHKKRISKGQEKQNRFCEIPVLFLACSSLLGIYQKVSLRLMARVFPQKFPPSISSILSRKYFVDFSECWRLQGVCRD